MARLRQSLRLCRQLLPEHNLVLTFRVALTHARLLHVAVRQVERASVYVVRQARRLDDEYACVARGDQPLVLADQLRADAAALPVGRDGDEVQISCAQCHPRWCDARYRDEARHGSTKLGRRPRRILLLLPR